MRDNCPICFSDLQVKNVAPCYVCGGWEGVKSKEPVYEFSFPDGSTLTLCNICYLEDLLSNQGDLKERLKITNVSDLSICLEREHPIKDKYCPTCNQRYAMLKLMLKRLTDEDLEYWRKK